MCSAQFIRIVFIQVNPNVCIMRLILGDHRVQYRVLNFHGDLIVTENGIATADDTRRVAFIEAALAGVQNCIADGIPVKGYFHWSLMDNFEWQKGYAMNFGLIAVNRETMQRTAKPSLAVLGSYTNA